MKRSHLLKFFAFFLGSNEINQFQINILMLTLPNTVAVSCLFSLRERHRMFRAKEMPDFICLFQKGKQISQ